MNFSKECKIFLGGDCMLGRLFGEKILPQSENMG